MKRQYDLTDYLNQKPRQIKIHRGFNIICRKLVANGRKPYYKSIASP